MTFVPTRYEGPVLLMNRGASGGNDLAWTGHALGAIVRSQPAKAQDVPEQSNEQLATAAREGDMDAFRILVERLEPRVAATVIGMLGPGADADDIGQETFIRFFRALKSFRGDSSVVTYVTRIAINLAKNELSRQKRRHELYETEEAAGTVNMPDPHADSLPYEDKVVVRRALNQLRPDYRAVIVLRIQQGFSTAQTSEILNVPEGTVTSWLARAQMKLRELLAPQFGVRHEPED